MIKPFTVSRVRDEVDGTVTIFYSVGKSVVEEGDTKIITTRMLNSHTNVPRTDNMDFDMIVFKALEGTGWL